ncbi:MAG: hypothetical protein FWF59_02180 [Turicibacter sp.]|nr:hypothetical protein [Turicibacter sp.]
MQMWERIKASAEKRIAKNNKKIAHYNAIGNSHSRMVIATIQADNMRQEERIWEATERLGK